MRSRPGATGDVGLLRLHNTYRHDLKIYSSDEGRVQMTAAAFVKGLLGFDGHLTPILASLINRDSSVNRLLDDSFLADKDLKSVKKKIHKLLLARSPANCVKVADEKGNSKGGEGDASRKSGSSKDSKVEKKK